VVTVVCRGDHPVRELDRWRGTVERVLAGGEAGVPRDRPARRQDVNATGCVEARDENVGVGERLSVGRAVARRADRVDESAGAVEPIDPAADLGDELATVR
jgi:hypothetical protein